MINFDFPGDDRTVYYEELAGHDVRGLGLKGSGIMSDDPAQSFKLMNHNLQALQILLFYYWPIFQGSKCPPCPPCGCPWLYKFYFASELLA